MHPSSYDRMADFCRDYLGDRTPEPLTIVDLGSADYNGSYRPIFAKPPWRYLGVDLEPWKNVDLVVRDPYHWRELKTASVDVVVSGQTFEHTEFFWETILEIVRILKPGGLCCLIAPASGNEHRYPVDCWRIYTDGFRAIARYAGLTVLYSRTHWEELPRYDTESNKWHESILIARKEAESLGTRLRRGLFASARRWLHPLPKNVEAMVQVFYTPDGDYREAASVVAGVPQGAWRTVRINLPGGSGVHPLRIDFMRAGELAEIAQVRVFTARQKYFAADSPNEFDRITVAGDAERIADGKLLRLKITGADPQLYLPRLDIPADEPQLRVELDLRIPA